MQRIKTLFFTLMIGFVVMGTADAQRIAIVDIDAVLESMSEYQSAQKELDRIAAEWRQEIQKEYDKIRSLYNKYQAEQVLLSEQARADHQDEIMESEQQVRDLQKQRFGPEGGLFQKRQDLIRPIQDQVFGAIKSYADDRGYDFIFDKGGATGLIFSNDEYDKTEDIKRKLGVK